MDSRPHFSACIPKALSRPPFHLFFRRDLRMEFAAFVME
jgi:hypothetical protein